MTWRPQDVVALLLGFFLILSVVFRFVLGMSGHATLDIEMTRLWTDLLQVVVGGLLVYVGVNHDDDS